MYYSTLKIETDKLAPFLWEMQLSFLFEVSFWVTIMKQTTDVIV